MVGVEPFWATISGKVAHYRYNGMRVDFSWDKTGDEYLSVYRQAVEQSLTFA